MDSLSKDLMEKEMQVKMLEQLRVRNQTQRKQTIVDLNIPNPHKEESTVEKVIGLSGQAALERV